MSFTKKFFKHYKDTYDVKIPLPLSPPFHSPSQRSPSWEICIHNFYKNEVTYAYYSVPCLVYLTQSMMTSDTATLCSTWQYLKERGEFLYTDKER